MSQEYPIGDAGRARLDQLVAEMKRSGQRRAYDCVVGVSGGCDSSFLIHEMVRLGVRPLAVHFDNTWNSPIATQNIYNVLNALKVDLETLVVESEEFDDLVKAFVKSGLKETDAPTDIGLTTTMYHFAAKHRIPYIVEGHSFRTEGISPLGWLYMDGRLIRDVHSKYGTVPMKSFPNLTLSKFLRWSALGGFKRVRPLYFMDYRKEAAKELLSKTYGWKWYGGHHLENRSAVFFHNVWLPQRFGIDTRVLGYAALVRSGQWSREEALRALEAPIPVDPELLEYVKKRLGLTSQELDDFMQAPIRVWTEFKTYKRTFERLRPFFWLLYKLDRVPKSFYLKFARRTLAPKGAS